VVTGRYFSLGPQAGDLADAYLKHYYGAEYFGPARADTFTSADQIQAGVSLLSEAGCTDVIFYPCSGDICQIERLAQVPGITSRRHGTNSTAS
jgi:hypothetical protein